MFSDEMLTECYFTMIILTIYWCISVSLVTVYECKLYFEDISNLEYMPFGAARSSCIHFARYVLDRVFIF